MPVTIAIRNLDAVMRTIGTDIKPAIRAASLAIGEEIRGKLAVYPGPVKYPIQWASEKQRRFYFAMRAGKLPYVRNSDAQSQRIGPSWTTARRGDIGAVVGTRATYAPWVQDSERQQPFHRNTGWITDKAAVGLVQKAGHLKDIITDAIMHALGQRGR